MIDRFREGVIVKPYERLDPEQVKWLDQASMSILNDPGIWCYNEKAAKLFKSHGAKVWEEKDKHSTCWRISFPFRTHQGSSGSGPFALCFGGKDSGKPVVIGC